MTEASIVRLVLSLGLIVLMILAGAWLTRRAGWLRPAGNRSIKLLGSQSLGPRSYVALVEVDNTRLVLGVTANQISLLHTLPESAAQSPEVAVPSPAPESGRAFAGSLRKIMAQRR